MKKRNIMRRSLALILTVLLTIGTVMPSFAQEVSAGETTAQTIESETGSGNTLDSETETKDETLAESMPLSESESVTESETSADSNSILESETSAESKSEAESESAAESETVSESDAVTESENESETETVTESENESEGEYSIEDDPEADRSYRQSAVYDSPIMPFAAGEDRDVVAYGIDVSYFQGDIDWQKVKAAGVDFAIIRVALRGYGTGEIVMDPKAIDNLKGAQSAGVGIGAYFFSTSLNEEEAIEEAEYLINVLKDYNVTYPVVFDFEGYEDPDYRTYGLSKTQRSNNAIAFLTTIENAGYQGAMYGSQSYLQNDNQWDTSRIDELFDVWVAQYFYYDAATKTQYPSYASIEGRSTTYTGDYIMWQFTSQGEIDGISGDVDLNLLYEDPSNAGSGSPGQATQSGTEKYENGNWYYYYEDGTKATGWVKHHGNQYYYDKNGAMAHGITEINGVKYGFDEWTGVLLSGEHHFTDTANNDWYYFYDDGRMATGWVKHHGNQYYYDKNGVMAHKIATINGKKYGFNEWTGVQLLGEHHFTDTDNDDWYYFNPQTGVMAAGWTQYNGHTYYFENDGKMYHGEKYLDGYWYYFDEWTGIMATGWTTHHNEWYYYDDQGRMYHGEHYMNGHWYYFDEWTGITANKGFTYHHGHWYYYNDQGWMQYGRQYIDGKWYYFNKYTGVLEQ